MLAPPSATSLLVVWTIDAVIAFVRITVKAIAAERRPNSRGVPSTRGSPNWTANPSRTKSTLAALIQRTPRPARVDVALVGGEVESCGVVLKRGAPGDGTAARRAVLP